MDINIALSIVDKYKAVIEIDELIKKLDNYQFKDRKKILESLLIMSGNHTQSLIKFLETV